MISHNIMNNFNSSRLFISAIIYYSTNTGHSSEQTTEDENYYFFIIFIIIFYYYYSYSVRYTWIIISTATTFEWCACSMKQHITTLLDWLLLLITLPGIFSGLPYPPVLTPTQPNPPIPQHNTANRRVDLYSY